MTFASSPRDRTLPVVFGQIELLHEMALGAGEAALASDLSATLAGALARYCEEKRALLSAAISAAPDDSVRRTG